ncbi:MAG: HAMP domain-containing sensor histidine kinase [Chloroflexota bacterium]|nr:HAMP domain-containing sensor histidine kinase [Chloroflexota bacterium]
MRTPTFTKSIHFKLTIWYSGILILLTILLIIGLNLAVRQGSMEPPPTFPYVTGGEHTPKEVFFLARQAQLDLLRNYSIIGISCIFVLGGMSIYLLSRQMLKPVDTVSSLASRISHTNLRERINYHGPDDEVKRLADTFDDMLGRLEGAFESQKQFVQDASHELRTPIAIAQTNIEVLEMEKKATIKDYKHAIGVIKNSLERMSRLNDELLALSAEYTLHDRMSEVDASSLTREAAAEAGARAESAGITIDIEAGERLIVPGDAARLKQAVTNLIDNAIKYNKPEGSVRVRAFESDSDIVVEVEDSGIGISQVDQGRVFDRFYRVDKSRSRAQGGSGLGLAIVKKIVEDHGGIISVESTPGAGSTFSIKLPKHNPD